MIHQVMMKKAQRKWKNRKMRAMKKIITAQKYSLINLSNNFRN